MSFKNTFKSLLFSVSIVLIMYGNAESQDTNKDALRKLDLLLSRDISFLTRYWEEPSEKNYAILRALSIEHFDQEPMMVFIYFKEIPNVKTLDDLSDIVETIYPHTWIPPVGIHAYGYMIAKVKSRNLIILASRAEVTKVSSAYRELQPLNDNAALFTGAEEAWNFDPPVTGRNVKLAILDSGFQPTNPDLPEAYASMDYSEYPDSQSNVTDRVSAHGTHVAGTAFGSGYYSDGRWKGLAYEAAPIYFKIGNNINAGASSAAVVGAIKGAATWSEAQIASMSYGGYDGFNDGTSAEDQAVDWAVGEGLNVFMSAGNQGTAFDQYSEVLAPNSSSEPIIVLVRFAQDTTMWSLYLSWFDSPDTSVHTEMFLEVQNANREEILTGYSEQLNTLRGTESIIFTPVEFLPTEESYFYVIVHNRSDREQRFHLSTFSRHWFVRFRNPTRTHNILLPSTADSCISVGAYVSRNQFFNYLGEERRENLDLGVLANFSSIGPRIDGVLKPNITGPGMSVISSLNNDIIDDEHPLSYLIVSNDGESGLPANYISMMGTSMSSPATAACGAMILEMFPDLTPSEFRNTIYRTALRDDQTGQTPNNKWGFGKIFVAHPSSIDKEQIEQPLPKSHLVLNSVYPMPFNNQITVSFTLYKTDVVSFSLYDLNGRAIYKERKPFISIGEHHHSLSNVLKKFGSGTYVLSVSTSDAQEVKQVIYIK